MPSTLSAEFMFQRLMSMKYVFRPGAKSSMRCGAIHASARCTRHARVPRAIRSDVVRIIVNDGSTVRS